MTCRQSVDDMQISCESSADAASADCSSWKNDGQKVCASYVDEGSYQCSYYADEGHQECDSWADEGYSVCCDWAPCSWFCDAFVWVSNVVCNGWVWVANLVCQGWYWVANLVCQAWILVGNLTCQISLWFVKKFCLLFSWIAKLICVSFDSSKCFLASVLGIGSHRGGRIKHVFVLVLENRACDHMLGFSRIAGTDAGTGSPTSFRGVHPSTDFNVDPKDGAKVFVSIEADFKLNKPPDDDPGHEFDNTVTALCGPGVTYQDGGNYPTPITNSGFIANYAGSDAKDPKKIMKCYSPARVPVLNELAREFAICDMWFSSIPGPTVPNRFFYHAASSGGLDDSPSGFQIFTNTAFEGYRFQNGTIFDRFDDACLEWRVFAGDSFPVTLALSGMATNELEGRIHDYDDFREAVNDPTFSATYVFIEPDYGNDLPPSAQDYTCGNSQHPLDDVTRGERLIKHVYESIRNSPHWNSSVLFVGYDEHGGFFDHIKPPPAVPPGDQISDEDNNHHSFTFAQLGVRVPAVIVSSLIPRGIVDHTIYDHTSLLATVEQLFNLKPLTQRDAAANTFSHLFSLASPRTNAPETLKEAADSGYLCNNDPNFPKTGEASSDLRAEGQASEWQRDGRPVGSTLKAFQEIALLKALKIARGRDKQQIKREYLAARTHGGAKHFIRKVAIMTQRLRSPAPGATKPNPRRKVLRTPPPREWWSESLNTYRNAKSTNHNAKP